MRNYLLEASLMCGAIMWAGLGFAQDPVLTRLYGSGVHEYFAGNYAKAHGLLSRAIEMGFEDPRAYYFRGLAYLKLGRPDEAEDDFRKGAEIEARDIGITYDIGRALERVQGRARMILERHRFTARTAALERAQKIRRERYGEQRARQQGFILEQAQPTPAPAVAQPQPAVPAEGPAPAPPTFPVPPRPTPSTDRGPEPLPQAEPAPQLPALPAPAQEPVAPQVPGVQGLMPPEVEEAIKPEEMEEMLEEEAESTVEEAMPSEEEEESMPEEEGFLPPPPMFFN